MLVYTLHSRFAPASLLLHYETFRLAVDANFPRALLFYVGFYALAAAVSLPGTILFTAIGGLLFGALIGGAAAVVAASSGAVALFILARSAFGALLTGRAASVAARLREGMTGNAVFYLMFVRLAPVFPFWAVNLACAVVGVPLRLFAATTLVGIMPATFAFATAGAGLDGVIMAQKAAFEACAAAGGWDCRFDVGLRSLATPQLLGGLAVLAGLSLLPVALKRARVLRRSGATARD